MIRTSMKYIALALVVAAVLSLTASTSEACWRCGRASCYGCGWASYYTPCCSTFSACDPCGSSCWLGWRPGPLRRLFFGPCRWYCGGVSYVASCCGSVVSDCCGGAPVYTTPASPSTLQPTPAPTTPVPTTPAPAPAPSKSSTSVRADGGLLTIWVPEDAKVLVNGYETKSKGNLRQFVSYGLKPGFSYTYEVRATVTRNGKSQEEVRKVVLTAGQRSAVAFNFNAAPTMGLASIW